jgi:HPt (histidine-containing phosphotransfer) domain-containing protein
VNDESANPPALDAAIEAIWLKHRPLMFSRLAAIEAAVAAVDQGALDDELRNTAQRDAHKLAGALGTFGLHDGTLHARKLEHAFEEDGSRDVSELRDAARGLREQLESRPA